MEISTFNDDLFELEDFSRQLDDFISTEHDYVEGSLVIALTSKYGSGKTTFLEMWKSSMSNSDNSADKPLVISLNAWESDYCGDPLFAIISALIECLEINGKKNQVDKLVNAAKNLGLFVAVIGNQLATKMTGIDMGAASAAVKKKEDKHEQATQTIPDTFSVYQSRKSAMESLKCEIKSIVAEFKPRVLFLVDELDRCRPDYAIAYLVG
jgi:predicted KAP-like P-loop ATPase